jgi:TonB C terminal
MHPLRVPVKLFPRMMIALGCSLLLHALWLLKTPKRAQRPPQPHLVLVPFELSSPAAPTMKTEPAAASEPKPQRPRPVVSSKAKNRDAPSRPVPVDAEPSNPVFNPTSDVPRRQQSVTVSLAALMVIDAGVVDLTRGEQSSEEPSSKRLEAVAQDEVARAKVERGQVHPYFSDMGKQLLKNWDADRVISGGGLKSLGQQAAQNMQTYNTLWAERAARYAQTGSPLDEGVAVGGRVAPSTDRVGALPGVDLEGRKALQQQLRSQFTARRQATIEVTQIADGTLAGVRLLIPSLDAAVDKEALVDIRAAASKLPRPPLEVAFAHQRIVSVWSFELVISISPPIPTFAFEFDEVTGTLDPRLPLDRRIYKKVRLVSVRQVE